MFINVGFLKIWPMRKISLIILGVFTVIVLNGQSTDQQTPTKLRRFHVGIGYSFIQTDMKLTGMTTQSFWNGTSGEKHDFNDDELNDLNSREKSTRKYQSIAVEAGMILLNKPGGKWFIDGTIMIGLASANYKIWNNEIDTIEMVIKSGLSLPSFGLLFNIRYNFNPHWGISVMPEARYSFGVNKQIDDNIYGKIEYFNESRKCNYNYLYGNINLLAAYTIKGLTISAGPGFYTLYNTNFYKLERVNPANGDTYRTEVKTSLVPRAFIDGNIVVEWKIIDLLTLTAYGALGKDFIVRGAIRCNL